MSKFVVVNFENKINIIYVLTFANKNSVVVEIT